MPLQYSESGACFLLLFWVFLCVRGLFRFRGRFSVSLHALAVAHSFPLVLCDSLIKRDARKAAVFTVLAALFSRIHASDMFYMYLKKTKLCSSSLPSLSVSRSHTHSQPSIPPPSLALCALSLSLSLCLPFLFFLVFPLPCVSKLHQSSVFFLSFL